ncbi:MAG: hypothetical protein HRT36_02645 [Alphaproteobacteria bacterium]|nr:hypothetical protein [Alphaproteobacteria bacterium]
MMSTEGVEESKFEVVVWRSLKEDRVGDKYFHVTYWAGESFIFALFQLWITKRKAESQGYHCVKLVWR